MLRPRTEEGAMDPRLLPTPEVLGTAAAMVEEEGAISLLLLPTPEVLGAEEEAEEGAIPPLTRTPLAAVGVGIPPLTRTPLAAVGVGIPPLTRTPLAAVGATRAEETLPTRTPRVAPTTPLLTTPLLTTPLLTTPLLTTPLLTTP
jgi:hypothetical protein